MSPVEMDPADVVERHLRAVRKGDDVAAMAADYGPDAVLVRGAQRLEGVAAIATYFAALPARLEGGRVDVRIEQVVGTSVTCRWTIEGGPAHSTSGHDVFVIGPEAIEHQTVHFDEADF